MRPVSLSCSKKRSWTNEASNVRALLASSIARQRRISPPAGPAATPCMSPIARCATGPAPLETHPTEALVFLGCTNQASRGRVGRSSEPQARRQKRRGRSRPSATAHLARWTWACQKRTSDVAEAAAKKRELMPQSDQTMLAPQCDVTCGAAALGRETLLISVGSAEGAESGGRDAGWSVG